MKPLVFTPDSSNAFTKEAGLPVDGGTAAIPPKGMVAKVPRAESPRPPLPSPAPTADAFRASLALYSIEDQLPSRCWPYPKGVRISINPFVLHELETVSSGQGGIAEHFLMLNRGLFVEGMPLEQMTLADYLYVIFTRKLLTIGYQQFRYRYWCSNESCRRLNIQEADTREVEFEYMKVPLGSRPPLKYQWEGVGECHFMPLTIAQYIQGRQDGLDLEARPVAIAMQCANWEYDSIYPVLQNSTGTILEDMWEIDDILYHGLKPMEAQCPACATVNHTKLDGWRSVILPFRRSEEPTERRISFGS